MRYRKDIQGLRALAILFVFVYHLNPNWFPGGFIGVDVFFVLSGFLMANIVLEKQEQHAFSFIGFYVNRIKRIVPAYYVMLLITAFVACFILIGDNGFSRELKHAAGFNSNYCYAKVNSYFGRKAQQTPLLHTWSIAVEMKFYLLLPLLLIVTKRRLAAYVVSFIAIVLLLFSIYESYYNHNTVSVYYSVLTRMPEFCIGILTALLSLKIKGKNAVISGISALVILLGTALFYNSQIPFPGYIVLVPCLATALLLITISGPVFTLLSSSLLGKIGNLSYSVYLWHWPVMALLRYYYGIQFFSAVQIIFVVVATLGIAWLSYTFVEEKFRRISLPAFFWSMIPLSLALTALYFSFPGLNEKYINIPAEYRGTVFGMKSHNRNFVEVYGDTTVQPKMVLVGNSHALSMKPYLDYLGKKHNFSFRTITSNSYLAISGMDGNPDRRVRRYSDFEGSQQLVALTEKEIRKAKVIVMVMSSWKMLPSQMPAIAALTNKFREDQHIIFVSPFPILDKNPVEVNRGFVKRREKQQEYSVKRRKRIKALDDLLLTHKNAHFIDMQESMVFNDAPFYNDTLLYYDARHLNKFGSIKLAQHTGNEFMLLLDSLE